MTRDEERCGHDINDRAISSHEYRLMITGLLMSIFTEHVIMDTEGQGFTARIKGEHPSLLLWNMKKTTMRRHHINLSIVSDIHFNWAVLKDPCLVLLCIFH